jgi:hypothetical protein
VTSSNYESLENFPISDWVNMVAEGPAEYATQSKRTRRKSKEEFFKAKK